MKKKSSPTPKSPNTPSEVPRLSTASSIPQPAPTRSTSSSDNVKVVCRFRPMNMRELELDAEAPMICLPVSDSSVKIGSLDNHEFKFDKVFMPNATQDEVFEFVGRPIVEDIMAGYNGTVLAYGQTGSGKTFTMMGGDDGPNDGLVPKAAHLIFETIQNSDSEYVFTITCSMLEIYKEMLRDLLDPSDVKLSIKTDADGVYIEGLSEDYIGDEDELMEKIAYGQANRTVAATKMNARSSRSHQLFILKVCQKLPDGMEKTGILNLVDLAGSEKINMSGVTGNKLEEAKKINLSLSMLGNVIHSLSSGASHIPYRDSKLTRILQESLGGNYKTCLVVTASPHVKNTEETISTLKFAQRAKTIKNKAVLNVKETPEVIIARLKKQLEEAYSYIELLKKSMTTCPVDGPLGMNPFEPERRHTSRGEGEGRIEGEGRAEGDSKIETGSVRDDDDVRSAHSFHLPNFDIDKNWESLISQYTLELEGVKKSNMKINTELEDLKRKLKIAKAEKRSAEKQMMDMAMKAKQLSDKQVYLVEDMQKDERIQQLTREVEALKRMLRDSLTRQSSTEKNVEIVEFEEELSLNSDCSSESETSSRVIHALPLELEGVTTLSQLPDPWEYPHPTDLFTLRNQLLQAEFINFKLSRRLEAKTWVCNAQSHKISLMTTRLNVVKEQFRGIQTLFEHVLHAYRSLSRTFRGLAAPVDDPHPVRAPTVRKLVNQKDIARQQTRRASIMAFRFQAFQAKTSNVKESFSGERPTSQNPSIAEEGQRDGFSSKAIDKLLRAIKSGDDDEAEMIQRRCEEIEGCIADIESRIYSSHKAEMARWSQFLSHLRDNYESELAKRQEDVRQLNGALSAWVKRFLDLQEMLLPQDYEKCSPKVEDILRILDRTQQLAADSLREKSRLSTSWLGPREMIERHEGDYGDEILENFDEEGVEEDEEDSDS